MKCDIFLMILNSKKHEGQIPKMELALLFQISLHLYTSFCSTRPERAEAPSPGASPWVITDATLSPCKGKSFKIPGNIQSFCPYRAPC